MSAISRWRANGNSMRFKLQRVQLMPKELKTGVLYVSEEFGTAAHLCACGCGVKIRTPMGPTEWSVEETKKGPSLWPSVGNWQQACQSHYVIYRGEVIWADKWSSKRIAAGRHAEESRRKTYFDALDRQHDSASSKFWRWVRSLAKR